jgi:tetratricopeptide (TPR) repeat protein
MEGGEKLKNIGNELFKQGKYVEAIAKYTQSANAYPMNPVVYANRAAAHLATKECVWVRI